MADNVEADAGSGGASFATNDIGGYHHPRNKLSLGADGSATDAVGGAGAVSSAVQRVTLASDDPAVAKLASGVTAKLDTATIQNGSTALTPKFASISGNTSGDNTLVSAVSGKKIRVLSITVISAGDVDFRIEDGAGGSALSGVMTLTANSGFSASFSPVGHFETSSNTLLNMELSDAIQVSGFLTYIEI